VYGTGRAIDIRRAHTAAVSTSPDPAALAVARSALIRVNTSSG